MQTYLSRDGGLSWKAILERPTVVQILNRGAFLVFAFPGIDSDFILISSNFGQSFYKLKLFEAKVRVGQLYAPDRDSLSFFVYSNQSSKVRRVDLFNNQFQDCTSQYFERIGFLEVKGCRNGRLVDYFLKRGSKFCWIPSARDLWVARVCPC